MSVAAALAWAGVAGFAASSVGVARGIAHPRSSLLMPVVHRADPTACGRAAALTFDDGPHPVGTPAVLAALARRHVRATFFVVGEQARRHPDLVRAIADAGHLVANHSHRHGHADALRGARWWRGELERCNDAVDAAVGRVPTLFRPPMGVKSPRMGVAVERLGLTTVTWTRRARDGRRAEAGRILERLRTAGPGEILTLHDGVDPRFGRDPRPTAAAVGPLIDALLDSGRLDRLARVDELISAGGAQRGSNAT